MITLIDYYADWCGPCHHMEPILEELEPLYSGKVEFQKLDVDDPVNREKVQKAGVMSIPTFIIERDGAEVDRKIGATPKDAFKAWIDSHISE